MATIFLIWFVVFYTNFRPRGFLVAMSAWFAVITVLNLLPPRGRFFISSFGLYLLIMTLSSVGNNGINAQIANILPNVYGMDERTTSALISLAGLLNIGLFIVAGRWMARSGGMTVQTTATVIRFIGALGMALVGMMANAPILLAADLCRSCTRAIRSRAYRTAW